jgi:hypothetical protein
VRVDVEEYALHKCFWLSELTNLIELAEKQPENQYDIKGYSCTYRNPSANARRALQTIWWEHFLLAFPALLTPHSFLRLLSHRPRRDAHRSTHRIVEFNWAWKLYGLSWGHPAVLSLVRNLTSMDEQKR